MKRTNKINALLMTSMLLAVPAAMYGSAGTASGAKGSLEQQVEHKLLMLPYYSIFDDISFRVDNGTVLLFGEVTEPWIKDDAGSAVKHIEGVTAVKNEIEVLPLSPFDNRIRFATLRAIYGYGPLQRYGLGSHPPIHIIVKDGNVTLAGAVANEMDRNLAYMRANSVPGVFSVNNELRVQP